MRTLFSLEYDQPTPKPLKLLLTTPSLSLPPQVCPGPFESAPNAHVGYNVARTLQHKVPMRRFGSMGEIAALVKFITSEAASFVTGTNIPVDGGWSCQ